MSRGAGIVGGPAAAVRIAIVLLLATGAADDARADICARMDVRFTGRTPGPVLIDAMEHEASAIWKPYGVGFEWTIHGADTNRENRIGCAGVDASFDVVIDRGPASLPSSADAQVLGATRVPPGPAIDHVPIYVDYDATELALEAPIAQVTSGLWGRRAGDTLEIGRALGRVVAHEVGHVVLGAPFHQAEGLMRESFAAPDLAAFHRRTFTLSPREVLRLRQRERALAPPSAESSDPPEPAARSSKDPGTLEPVNELPPAPV